MQPVLSVEIISLLAGCLNVTNVVLQADTIKLRDPQTITSRFAQIDGVRELPDGRVVIADSRLAVLTIADFKTGQSAVVGKSGSGPHEYLSALSLFPFSENRTVLVDGRNSRLLLLTPGGVPSSVLHLDSVPGDRGLSRFLPIAADSRGRFYAPGPLIRVTEDGLQRLDSVAFERWDPAARKLDTIAYLRTRSQQERGVSRTEPMRALGGPSLVPFVIGDQVAVDTAGRVAILRWDEYRVDFVSDDGIRTRGPKLPYVRIRISDAHKRSWRAQRETQTCRSSRSPNDEPPYWPEFLPPFLARPAVFAPDGSLWVRRTTEGGAPARYDVLDRSGHLAGVVELPSGSCVIGFGNTTLYVVRETLAGSQQLQRFLRPQS